jgi:hypothetical protein
MSESKQYPMATGREDVLQALRVAAQAKGAPLTDAEREAVYASAFKKSKKK